MIRQRAGVILALDSGSAHGSPMMGATGPADAATDTFIRNPAVEIGPRGVRVLGIWTAGLPETLTPERLAAVNRNLQLDAAAFQGRWSSWMGCGCWAVYPRLAQVAVAAFLASDQAAAITGTFVNVTSGAFPS